MVGQGLSAGIKVIGKAAAQRKLMKAKKEAGRTKPLYNKAIIILEMSQAKTFRMQGRPRWTKSMRAKDQGGKTLQDTNKLMQSVTAKTSDSIRLLRGKALVFGTKVIYGPSHQFGYKKRKIPKRRFLGVYPEDIKKMEGVFSTDIENRIRVVVASG